MVRRKTWIFRGLAIFSGMLIAFSCGEIIVRFSFWQLVDEDTLALENRRRFVGDFVHFSKNPELSFELRPNTRVQRENFSVAISDDGYCRISAEKEREKTPSSALRIALIGDSSSFGWRVNFEQSYAHLLQQQLQNHFHRPITLRNYSVPGYNSRQQYACLETKVLPWRPDLIVLHYDHNDAEPTRLYPAQIPVEYGNNLLHSALIKLVLRQIKIISRQAEIDRRRQNTLSQSRLYQEFRYHGPYYDEHLHYLQKIARLCHKSGIPTVVMVFDTILENHQDPLSDPHYQLLHKQLVPRLQKMDFIVYELYRDWQQLMRQRNWADLRQLWVSSSDPHPNAAGHALIAENLFRFFCTEEQLQHHLHSDSH